jgi:glutamate-5-semialdehyde dehydrogenase
VILRGGRESLRSAGAIHLCLLDGLREAGLPEASVQVAQTADRGFVAAMLRAAGLIDLIVPRGGKGLVERVQQEARVPVLAHAEGLCHTYVHAAADPAMARRIVANAKMRRTGICGATETLLIDAAVAPSLLPPIVDDLRALGCSFRADDRARAIVRASTRRPRPTSRRSGWTPCSRSASWTAWTRRSPTSAASAASTPEAIITEDAATATHFLDRLGSAVGMWNASTQFCDGGEFGFGAEIGIATGRMHARGPVGLEQLCTYRYQVIGTGQTRP